MKPTCNCGRYQGCAVCGRYQTRPAAPTSDRNGPSRPLTDRDRAFLAKHRALAREDDRPARGSADRVEIAGEVRGLSASGLGVRFFDGTKEVWLPISQVEDVAGGLAMPEWLAKDKGLI